MTRKELEPYVSYDVTGLFSLLASKKRNKHTLSESPLRNKIMRILNENVSSSEEFTDKEYHFNLQNGER